MTRSEIDAIVSDYFRRLEALLSGLPAADREQLLAEIHEHVERARSGLPDETPAAIRALLERVGRPEEIAQEALGEQAGSHHGRRPLIVAAIVVAVVAAVAVVLGLVASSSSTSPAKVAVAPSAAVGGFPTGIAFDPASGTVYVASGVASDLTMLDTSSCNAQTSNGCAAAKTVSTGGQDAIGVVVDDQTGTVYAVNGGSDSVAVINARTCNVHDTTGCSKTPALVSVPGGPEFIALNAKTNTVYVADTNSGTVSMINGNTCNASDHAGCTKAPAEATAGQGAFPIAVDETTNTVYVGTLGGDPSGGTDHDVSAIDGSRCDSANTSGCAAAPATLSAGGGPAGITLDPTTGTVYVSSENGTVAVINAKACNGTTTKGCAAAPATVAAQADPRGNALDPATDTLYVTNAGSNTVSMVNTTTCNAADPAGCSNPAPSFPVGASPRRIAIDPAAHSAYIVNTEGNSVSIINTQGCNATDQAGCPTQPAAGASAAGANGLPVASAPATNSSCSPATSAASSGTPAATLTSGATQVDSGTVDGMAWTLWSAKGQSGANALEDGGLVLNGRAYHLCPGYPNPAELELINTGHTGIVVGVIGYPGKTTIKLTTGTTGTFTPGTPLPTPTVHPVNGVSFFIGTLPKSACAYPALELNSTSGKISAEHNLGFSGCTPNKLVPISFSQGIWQLPAGHFVNNFGNGGRTLAPGVPTANAPLANSTCTPTTTAASSGAAASTLTSGARQVGSGTVDGVGWTLWSKNGQTGANGLEDGGLVVNGRAYGLCPGYPNPAELELLKAGDKTLVYGVIGYPGKATIKLTTGTTGTFTPGTPLPTPTVHVINGVSFFIGTLPKPACAYPALELDSTSGKVSAEHDLGFSGCTPNKLVPITFSQGIWQLPAGHFVNNFGSGPTLTPTGTPQLATTIEGCNPNPTRVLSGSQAHTLTASSTKVANGTVAGQPWSLWTRKGTPGSAGIEAGALVLAGRWYGLCPGAPNPAEFELIDSNNHGIAYGYIANPGPYTITLTPGTTLPSSDTHRIRGSTFFITALPRPACSYPNMQLDASTPAVNDLRYQSFGTCQTNKLVTVTGGHGSW